MYKLSGILLLIVPFIEKCFLRLNFLINFYRSIYTSNVSISLSGAYLRPKSKILCSSSEKLTLLKLKILVPNIPFFFFFYPPHFPLVCLFFLFPHSWKYALDPSPGCPFLYSMYVPLTSRDWDITGSQCTLGFFLHSWEVPTILVTLPICLGGPLQPWFLGGP